MSTNPIQKGFTLIELLIVIGIIAILGTVVVLTLNPAELLKQARDSTRISDLATLKQAISLYQVDAPDVKLGDIASCYPSVTPITGMGATGCDADGVGALKPRFSAGTTVDTLTNVFKTDSTGWVRVNFSSITTGAGGPPISNLPRDPVNTLTGNLFYAYKASGTAACSDGVGATRCTIYEINAVLESSKFADQMVNDGGNANIAADAQGVLYEIGTDPGLDL